MKRILNFGVTLMKNKNNLLISSKFKYQNLNFLNKSIINSSSYCKYFSTNNKNDKDEISDSDEKSNNKENKREKKDKSENSQSEKEDSEIVSTNPERITSSKSEIKILKLSPDEEQSIEEFQNGLEVNTNSSKEDSSQKDKERIDNFPLIHHSQPILPFSKITITNPSKNDILFNMLIKYGKLTPIDEETTIIDDITIFFEKDDPFTFNLKSTPKKELSPHVLGVLCKITYMNKEKLIIEGIDKIYKVKTLRSGKLKFFNPKETLTIETNFENNKEYLAECLKLLKGVLLSHEYICSSLKLEPDYFSEGNKTTFDFNYLEISSKLAEMSAKVEKNNSLSEEEIIVMLQSLIQYSYFFILKASTFSNIIYQGSNISNEIFKLLYLTDLQIKLQKISEGFSNIQNFINLKYDFYNFPQPHNLQFQTDNPFAHENAEEMLRITKYKEVIENKISEVDTIEKQKEEFKRKISEIKSISEEVRKSLEKEISKISGVHMDQENGKRIEYLNHVLNLPWEKYDDPVWDIDHARNVLDGNLYGLNETKERIYEFIAKNMKKNNKKGCVILLTGGPGTGKTRIAKLIGEALKRKVGFVSLAGVSDGKSILGFKRTYVSSTPGMFIREMQHVGVKNPVIVIDEIDKVGFRHTHSNVYHALLQLLNPEENHRFSDHYLELPFDFSNVVFILTSNNDEIFPPLIDRMEVINVEPYVNYEKFLIVKNYAKDQILKDYNFSEYGNKFQITDRAIYKLIFEYCKREAGVRKAKKLLESVIRKVNSKIELQLKNNMQGSSTTQITLPHTLQINSKNILKILNEPKEDDPVLTDMIVNSSKNVGCCMGLFVSKSDQSNSWGSASIFSLSVKEIKDIHHDHTSILSDIKNVKENLVETHNDLHVSQEKLGLDIKQKIGKNHNEDSVDSIETEEKKLQKKKEKSKTKSSKSSSSTKKDKSEKSLEKKNQFRISSSGNLGEDSLQSVDIALNYATEFLSEVSPQHSDFFYKHQLHHDCPEILLPKSGPSAGIVIFLCSVSLALNKPLIPHLAMTGEICIEGSVLKIGGVKEKAQGAQQFGVKTLVIPIGNKYDFLDLPANLKDSFERVFFVENCRQVYNIGFNLDTSGIDSYVPEKCLSDINDLIEEEILVQNNLADQFFK